MVRLYLLRRLRRSTKAPTITSSKPSPLTSPALLPEIAGEAAFLADPTSPEDIYHKMMGIYFNEPKREEMIEAGYANAALFSWEKSASEMLKVYKYESIMA